MTIDEVKVKGSVQDFAEKWQVSKQNAYGLIKFLEAKKIAKLVGKGKPESGVGKPVNIYSLPESIVINAHGQ